VSDFIDYIRHICGTRIDQQERWYLKTLCLLSDFIKNTVSDFVEKDRPKEKTLLRREWLENDMKQPEERTKRRKDTLRKTLTFG